MSSDTQFIQVMIIWWCHFLEKEKQTNILIRNNLTKWWYLIFTTNTKRVLFMKIPYY